jgi:hypothetical protein
VRARAQSDWRIFKRGFDLKSFTKFYFGYCPINFAAVEGNHSANSGQVGGGRFRLRGVGSARRTGELNRRTEPESTGATALGDVVRMTSASMVERCVRKAIARKQLTLNCMSCFPRYHRRLAFRVQLLGGTSVIDGVGVGGAALVRPPRRLRLPGHVVPLRLLCHGERRH